MNRRRFFRSPEIPRTAGAALGPLTLPADEPAPPTDYALVRISRRAMATLFEIALPFGTPNALAAADDALNLIDELEDQLTVFRDHSEVSRLNATAAAGPVVVEQNLFDLLATCAAWTRETECAFDVATGALTKAWGFYRREGRVPTPPERAAAMARTGTRHVILNPEARSVKYRMAGLEINLGAVGKGYALDRAAELLRDRWGIGSALLHAGGSSVFALGHPPGEPQGWQIRLRHPWEVGQSLGTVWLRDRGLGTSAVTFQHFEYNGRKLGHLLDPRTGWPAEAAASASVTAPTAAEADAMSTAAFVLGPAADRLAARPQLGLVVLPNQDPSPNPSPTRGGGSDRPGSSPPSLGGKGAGGLGPAVFNLGPESYSPPARA
jgi:thiamine biosynthesis lipoprotein